MSRPTQAKSRAFTLIEVLVVIGVIALLIAILIPSLARSRENARAVICRSNLAEWGKAMLMYTDLYKGVLPFEERPDPDKGECVPGSKVWLDEGWVCWYDSMDSILGQKKDEGVKACPTLSRYDPFIEESYRMNSKLADYSRVKADGTQNPYFMPYRRLDSLKRPNQTVLLFGGRVGPGNDLASDPNPPPSFKGRWRLTKSDVQYRHNKKTNMLFTDWHIESPREKTLFQRSLGNQPVIWQPKDMGPWDPDPAGP